MTYNEWRDELKQNLLCVSEAERRRVLDYYAEAYADRRDAGFSEREIIADFGAPYDAAQRILYDNDDGGRRSSGQNSGNNYVPPPPPFNPNPTQNGFNGNSANNFNGQNGSYNAPPNRQNPVNFNNPNNFNAQNPVNANNQNNFNGQNGNNAVPPLHP